MYFGQKVSFWTMNGSKSLDKIGLTSMTKYSVGNRTLLLTPLSQITDEDAINSLKLIISSRDSSAFDYCKSQNYSIEQMVNYFNRHLVYDFKLILTDYLRSKGYALNYLDLSVEDLVEYGWIKLKSN